MPASDSSSDAPPNPTAPAPRSHPAGTTGRVLAVIAVAVVVLLGGIGTYEFVASHSGNGTTLVVYTYESLLGGCGSDVLTRLAQSFDQAHHAQLDIECVSGTL
ncbi:MAG TPA: hypothetical protein VLY85_01595, partial [Thermoplasmata archaeon]|nr:hypothetical protein [Thermoplasmata archaeon]